MGLIYVNPEGPGGVPDALLSAQHIRETFGRMAMNDEETVALVAGGHTFGKGHGAAEDSNHGLEPQLAAIEEQGFGWTSKYGSGKGGDTITSGLEGAWTMKPTQWDNGYFENLFKYEWELQKAPSGAKIWRPKDNGGADTVPDAHDPNKSHQPIMYTSDLAMRMDPKYEKISRRFYQNPDEFRLAFQKAWFKLTHRDMGVPERYLGPECPNDTFVWQDPVPKGNDLSESDVVGIKAAILKSEMRISELVRTAWSSASTFRQTDLRGGANGARIRLAPQRDWIVNKPDELKKVIGALEKVQKEFPKASIADLIVLGGCAAIEKAALSRGIEDLVIPVSTGRGDASQEMTDEESFKNLEPIADAFRNYNHPSPHQLVDRACLLGLTSAEMTVLIGGLRVLGVTDESGSLGVLTNQKETLSNDFFVNLLDMAFQWKRIGWGAYEGSDRVSSNGVWKASECDLIFGSNAELRAIAEYYAQSNEDFVQDFTKAWAKVMDADRV
jgi:catalase-peroxidase